MPQSELNKLLTDGLKRVEAFKKAKKDLEEWDDKLRAYFKKQINPELIQSPKDEDNFYK